ncbi:MAG: hypothetical protein JW712_08855 [Dehalococcoidales bacterium]|nr:hypothetical protein [Dehalococcoidales bacterium]
MDINFHYFAVKVLAVKAGFGNTDDAQTLATYSQMVDDFNWFEPFSVWNVPDFAQYLATHIAGNLYYFYPATTGFGFFDYARLLLPEYQKNILVPFHFITQVPLPDPQTDRKKYRVVPVVNGGQTLLNDLLDKACNQYKESPVRQNLIRIGTLLHIFADTYAHQRFSGLHGWENNAYLEDAVDNCTKENITSSYWPNFYYYMPSIGHPNVSTAPDDSNVSFGIMQKYDEDEQYPYKAHYSRSNTEVFTTASRQLIDYLRMCLNKGPIDDNTWNDLAVKLQKGFLTSEKNVSKLIKHWSDIFPDISFSYTKDIFSATGAEGASDGSVPPPNSTEGLAVPESILPVTMNMDFYFYNVIADTIRKTVNPQAMTIPESKGRLVLSE